MEAVHHLPHPDTLLVIACGGERYESKVQFSNFIDGDSHCLIEDTEHIKDAQVMIKHYLYPNQNEQIIRLLLIVGTIKNLGAASVEVFVPYLPYSRQDKAHFPGEAVAAELLCRWLNQAGVQMLYTLDCHFMKGASATEVEGLAITNLLVQDFLIKQLEMALDGEQYQVIGPDAGASYLAQGETMKKARAHNYRQNTDGSISRNIATLEDAHLQINHDTMVVADDMVSTGSTMIKALENLRARDVKNLYAMTTHGLFLKGSYEIINGITEGLFYSDSIPLNGAVPVVDTIFETILSKHP